jgi:hypothetical protein
VTCRELRDLVELLVDLVIALARFLLAPPHVPTIDNP